MRRFARTVSAALGLFFLVALLWAAIGYRYGGDHRLAAAVQFGGAALAAGWAFVAVVIAVKYGRLFARRRRSNEPLDPS